MIPSVQILLLHSPAAFPCCIALLYSWTVATAAPAATLNAAKGQVKKRKSAWTSKKRELNRKKLLILETLLPRHAAVVAAAAVTAAYHAAVTVLVDDRGDKLLMPSFICLIMAVRVACSSSVTGLPSCSLYWAL